jgi:hypothetical protein
MRASSRALTALSIGYLALGAIWSARAPCGAMPDAVFGNLMWNHSDPGGFYIASAHELYRFEGRLLYPGHPGLPMQMLLHAVQFAYFRLSASGLGFTGFIAKNIVEVFFLSKLCAVAAHVLSFWLLARFARGLLRSERASVIAAFAYATSLPVVYYLTRISVEPFMVVLFLVAFLALWSCGESLANGRRGRAYAAAALAGAAAVSALCTKFHLLWPLPALALLQLICGDEPPFTRGFRRPDRARALAIAAFAASASLTLALYSHFFDWKDFFAFWDVVGMDRPSTLGMLSGLIERQVGLFPGLARAAARIPLRDWLPLPTKSGLFFFCEAPMIAIAAYGAVLEARRGGVPRGRWLWPAAAAGYTAVIWLYRCLAGSGDFSSFHYLFIFVLLAAVLFARAAEEMLTRRIPSLPARKTAAAVLVFAALRQPVFWAARSAFVNDSAQYSRVAAFGEALGLTRDGERVAVIGRPADLSLLLGLGVLRRGSLERSALMEELAADFVFVTDQGMSARDVGRPVGAVVEVVVDGGKNSAVLKSVRR